MKSSNRVSLVFLTRFLLLMSHLHRTILRKVHARQHSLKFRSRSTARPTPKILELAIHGLFPISINPSRHGPSHHMRNNSQPGPNSRDLIGLVRCFDTAEIGDQHGEVQEERNGRDGGVHVRVPLLLYQLHFDCEMLL